MRKVFLFYPAIAVMTFLLVQALWGVLGVIFKTGNITWQVILSSVVTVVILRSIRLFSWRQTFRTSSIDWSAGMVGIAASVFGIVSLNIVEEMMPLPDQMQDTFIAMAFSIEGALCIAVIAPLVEEIVFRECMLGHMLRNGVNRWVAIVISSLVFGIIHLNPAQIPFATAIGIILGIVYYKSKNIVLTSIIHILNNSAALVQMHVLGDKAADFRLTEWFGSITTAVLCAVVAMVVCVVMLRQFWKTYKNKKYETVY